MLDIFLNRFNKIKGVVAILIFPEIDKKKTKTNAKKTLNMYTRLIRLARTASIPKITSDYYFTVEETWGRTIHGDVDIELELKNIAQGINKLDLFERRLIYDRFIHRKETNVALYLKYHISESKFYRELDKALLHFAEAYEGGQLLARRKDKREIPIKES